MDVVCADHLTYALFFLLIALGLFYIGLFYTLYFILN